ncbi:hypothetical protein [Azospirillum rugosum]|uniref:Uncharacterized protein n=1 Tax=Azospirillum rugosum TaxID=416170 RepID=A0ABS4SJP3_9PROT|nr:hypothetical protein [Azospirillum rugosum]MBP2292776.1 hypothetical protein [Azospirillum rugosum]MDQ0527035.1 hypothetical protein [Azospirillum rugosum]
MSAQASSPASDCGDALTVLDRILGTGAEDVPPAEVYNAMAEASRCLVRLRDGLIARRRAGDEGASARLAHVNAALSVAFGGEYPLVGVHRNRIEKTREQLRKLLDEIGGAKADCDPLWTATAGPDAHASEARPASEAM